MKQAPVVYIRWFLAEFLGTALLAGTIATLMTSAYLGIPGYESMFIPALVGLTLAVLIMLFGWVSGAHFNPAVTFSQALFRKVCLNQAGIYLVAQIAGAFVGVRLANVMLGTSSLTPELSNTPILVGEFIGTMVLTLGFTLIATKRISPALAPVAIGGSFALGLMLSAHTGGGVLNPAVAVGLGGYGLTFLITPVIGAVCGAAIAILFDETARAAGEA